jgi:hypothetical protein
MRWWYTCHHGSADREREWKMRTKRKGKEMEKGSKVTKRLAKCQVQQGNNGKGGQARRKLAEPRLTSCDGGEDGVGNADVDVDEIAR